MNAAQRRQIYAGYEGQKDPTERDRIVHFVDQYRASEGFVAEYLERWADVTPDAGLKGGLRTMHEREAAHERLLERRLRELGEEPVAKLSPARREQSLALYASAERSDREKLESIAVLFADPEDFMQPLVDLIENITDDAQTRELLRTILDDEWASIRWLTEMHGREGELGSFT
jgi:rubrerythrin